MKISLHIINSAWCFILFIFIQDSLAQKVNGLKGEVELITEPRPGDEFVQIHTTNGKHPNKFFKTAGGKVGGSKDRGYVGNERDIPIIPAKDKRLLRFTASQNSNEESEESDQMKVSIVDEGKTGFEIQNADEDERDILVHKIEPQVEKHPFQNRHHINDQENGSDEADDQIDDVSVYPESKSGIQRSDAIEDNDESPIKQLSTSKPILEKSKDKISEKKLNDKKYDVLTFNKQKTKKYGEENFDFVDSPFEDKLVSSGTSQTSRINVKKGPNGQDYEYEYVYYYYDEDDEKNTPNQQQQQQQPIQQQQQQEIPSQQRPTSRLTTTPLPPQTSWRQQPVPTTTETQQRVRGRPNENTRYTINGFDLESDIPTEKLSNELLPVVTPPSRFRGRTTEAETEPIREEIPTSTRFPPRARGSTTQNQHQQFVSTTTPVPAFEATPARTRGNIRRPSLGLVDSSSFRTHSSDVSPDQDQKQTTRTRGETQQFREENNIPTQTFRGETMQPHVVHSESFTAQPLNNFENDHFQKRPTFTSQRNLIENTPTESFQEQAPITRGNIKAQDEYRGETTRVSDLEEYITGTEVPIPVISDISQNTLVTKQRPAFASTDRTTNSFATNTGMPDKAAFDLYAILQQMHNEESNYLSEDNVVTVDQNGVPLPATIQFPIAAPTTTTSTTTTTTTTTTTPAPTTSALPVSESSLPGRFKGNTQRNRFKLSTTTTTENPDQTTARARKFQPSQQRPAGPSAYARRQKTSTTSPVEDSQASTSAGEEQVTKSKPRFGSRNRFSSSSGSRSDEGSRASTTSTTPESVQSPVTSKSSDRFNRRRPGRPGSVSTTAAPEGVESSSVASESSDASASTQNPSRGRLPSNNVIRPLRPGPRINIGGARGRLGVTSTTSIPTEEVRNENVSPDGAVSESAPQPAESHDAESHFESSPAEQTPSTTPDALSRLRNRPRLQPLGRPGARAQSTTVGSNATPSGNVASASTSAPVAAAPINQNRRTLGGLLQRQRPGQSTQATSAAPVVEEEKTVEETIPEDVQLSTSTEVTQGTTENKISSLISRRRNIVARRPGTLQTRQTSPQ